MSQGRCSLRAGAAQVYFRQRLPAAGPWKHLFTFPPICEPFPLLHPKASASSVSGFLLGGEDACGSQQVFPVIWPLSVPVLLEDLEEA